MNELTKHRPLNVPATGRNRNQRTNLHFFVRDFACMLLGALLGWLTVGW